MNQPFRLRYANVIVGTFTLFVLAAFIILTAFIFRRGQYFDEPSIFYLEVSQDEAGDLYEGAEVWMLGQRAGSVSSLRYIGDTDQVRIEMSIKSALADQVTDDVEIRLERKFGVGTPVLRIRRPSGDPISGDPISGDPISGDPNTGVPVETPNRPQPSSAVVRLAKPTVAAFFDRHRTPARRVQYSGAVSRDASDGAPALNPVVQPSAKPDLNSPNQPRRLKGFVGENDRLNQMSDQINRVADAVEAIRQRTVPTLDRVGESSDQLRTTMTTLDDATRKLQPQAASAMGSLDRAAKGIEMDVHDLSETMNDLIRGEVRSTVEEVKNSAKVTADASRRAEVAAAEAASAAKQAAIQAATAAQQVGAAASAVNQTSESTGQQIETTLADLRSTSAELRRLTRETLGVVRIVRDEANDLPGTANRINDAVDETDELVRQIQGHWLLRNQKRDRSVQAISPSSIRGGASR